ncbi:class I SAM-dependent methyltransferase [Candidatus Woesebacteria bacterium]|nr:class I SAM-dependent methyltransferase [Candidatus Woesebacteria bacterium]
MHSSEIRRYQKGMWEDVTTEATARELMGFLLREGIIPNNKGIIRVLDASANRYSPFLALPKQLSPSITMQLTMLDIAYVDKKGRYTDLFCHARDAQINSEVDNVTIIGGDFLETWFTNPFDIIWDRLGAGYYNARNKRTIIKYLQHAHCLLSPGGVLLIDAFYMEDINDRGFWNGFYNMSSTAKKFIDQFDHNVDTFCAFACQQDFSFSFARSNLGFPQEAIDGRLGVLRKVSEY